MIIYDNYTASLNGRYFVPEELLQLMSWVSHDSGAVSSASVQDLAMKKGGHFHGKILDDAYEVRSYTILASLGDYELVA